MLWAGGLHSGPLGEDHSARAEIAVQGGVEFRLGTLLACLPLDGREQGLQGVVVTGMFAEGAEVIGEDHRVGPDP